MDEMKTELHEARDKPRLAPNDARRPYASPEQVWLREQLYELCLRDERRQQQGVGPSRGGWAPDEAAYRALKAAFCLTPATSDLYQAALVALETVGSYASL